MNSRFPIILIFVEAYSYLSKLRTKPIITLFFVGAMILFHLNKNILGIYSNVSRACISYNYIWWNKQYDRLWWHSLVHLSDWHLYYNMVNLLWKGGTLEPFLGWLHYLLTICVIIPTCAIIYITIAYALFIFNGSYYGETYLFQCAAGFSGHLGGIIVGLLYTLGPLNWFINCVCQTNIRTNCNWIPFLAFYRQRSSRLPERETSYDEPYLYPFRMENQDSESYLNFSQQELMRNRILNATERRLTKNIGRRI